VDLPVGGSPRRYSTVEGRRRWALVCFAINFLYAVYMAGIGLILEPVGRQFGLGAAAQARLFPANFTGMIVSVLLCGVLADRFGPRRVLLTCTAVFAVALALFARAPVFGLALLAAAFIGAGSGGMQMVANALVAEVFVERQRVMVNATQIAFGAGAICGPLAASRLLTLGTDWRSLYLGLSVLIVLLFLAASALPPVPITSRTAKMNLAQLRSVAGQPAFLSLCIAAAIYAGAEVGFFQWMPSYFHLRLPDGDRWTGVIVSIFWAGMTAGRVAAGAMISRFPLTRLRAVLALAGALCATAAVLFPSPTPTMAFVAMTGLSFGGIFSLLLAEAGERFPLATGTVFGGVVAISGVGTALVPWAIGTLATTSLDWRGALLLVPLCAIVVMLNALWMGRQSFIRR
jgi:FHS family glucose/mannose:H+ symporter-like MFS transporter